MTRQILSTAAAPSSPLYSQGIKAGSLVTVSGMTGTDVTTGRLAGPTIQESKMTWRQEPRRLKEGAPNVLIVLVDDMGFGMPSAFGGPVRMPTADRLANQGLRYNPNEVLIYRELAWFFQHKIGQNLDDHRS